MSIIKDYLDGIGGLKFPTVICLNMHYYLMLLDKDIHELCTSVLPWGKYYYPYLPMGVFICTYVFQDKISTLLQDMVHACI